MKTHLSYISVIIILLVALVLERSCHKCPGTVTNTTTSTKVVAHNDTGKAYTPTPIKVDSSKPIGTTLKYKPISNPTAGVPEPKLVHDSILVQGPPQKVDTMAILRAFYNTYSYHEENYKRGDPFGDSMRKKFGYVAANIEVTQNRILSMGWESHQLSTETTTTKTVQRLQVYGGFDIYGNKASPIAGFGGTVIFKTKKDQMYNGGIALLPGNVVYGHVGMDWKITFKK